MFATELFKAVLNSVHSLEGPHINDWIDYKFRFNLLNPDQSYFVPDLILIMRLSLKDLIIENMLETFPMMKYATFV